MTTKFREVRDGATFSFMWNTYTKIDDTFATKGAGGTAQPVVYFDSETLVENYDD